MHSGSDLSGAELDWEGSSTSQGSDAAYESVLFPSLASTPAASMSAESFSEIYDSVENVGNHESKGVVESLRSSKDIHEDWEIVSEVDSWDEIFEDSDLCSKNLFENT